MEINKSIVLTFSLSVSIAFILIIPLRRAGGSEKNVIKQMGSGFMYAFIQKAGEGKEIFQQSDLGKNGKSCKSCHTEQGLVKVIGQKVTNRTIAAIQYCYDQCMKGGKVIPETALNYIVFYLISMESEV